jgi:hypothetical protein
VPVSTRPIYDGPKGNPLFASDPNNEIFQAADQRKFVLDRVLTLGEVLSSNGIPPQTQMGNGQFPSSTSAASMSTLCDVDAVAWVCWYRDLQTLVPTPPNPKYYDIEHTGFGATRYGGPGQ